MSDKTISFYKYEAAGNDFIIIDKRPISEHEISACIETYQRLAPRWCHRQFGIGADGILVMTQAPVTHPQCHIAMHIVNADGSIAAMCGNGIRCAARWFYEYGNAPDISPDMALSIYTIGGVQNVKCLEHHDTTWELEVAMAQAIPTHTCDIEQAQHHWLGQCVDVGNPHAVFEISSSPQKALETAGEFLSNHPIFPDRCNIEFIREIAPCVLEMTVYERGVGPTLACGTGCVASAVAYAKAHNILNATIQLNPPGGTLHVVIRDNQNPLLQGPANHVFNGMI